MLLLFLLVLSGYVISMAGCEKEGLRPREASHAVERADRPAWDLETLEEAGALVALIGGPLLALYYVRRSVKTGTGPKAPGKPTHKERP